MASFQYFPPNASPDEIVRGGGPLTGVAPVTADWGYDPTTGKAYYKDDVGDWAEFAVTGSQQVYTYASPVAPTASPADPSVPSIAIDTTTNRPGYFWNPTTATWIALTEQNWAGVVAAGSEFLAITQGGAFGSAPSFSLNYADPAFVEGVQDAVGQLVASAVDGLTYDDALNALTSAVAGAALTDQADGTLLIALSKGDGTSLASQEAVRPMDELVAMGVGTLDVTADKFLIFDQSAGEHKTLTVEQLTVDDVGMIGAFPYASVPNGWFICNGQTISRTVYSTLFGKIGTVYGAGDGSTTFGLPDLRGRFLRGLGGNSAALGVAQANATAVNGLVLSGAVVGTANPTTGTTANGQYGLIQRSAGGANTATGADASAGEPNILSAIQNHTHTLSGDTETRPDNYAVVYAIKALPALMLAQSVNAGSEEVIRTVTAGNAAPALADWGYDPATGDAFFVNNSGNWEQFIAGAQQVYRYVAPLTAPASAPQDPTLPAIAVNGDINKISHYWDPTSSAWEAVTNALITNWYETVTALAPDVTDEVTLSHNAPQNQNYGGAWLQNEIGRAHV